MLRWIIRYELQFADDADIICNVEQISVPGHFLEYRAQFAIGDAKFARIRAVNDAAVSDWSNLSSATAFLLPGVPQNVKATNENMIIVLAYTSPDQTGLGVGQSWPLLSYEILINSTCSSNGHERRIQAQNILLPRLIIQGLSKGCIYSFRVRPENFAGWSSFSKPVFEMALSLSSLQII